MGSASLKLNVLLLFFFGIKLGYCSSVVAMERSGSFSYILAAPYVRIDRRMEGPYGSYELSDSLLWDFDFDSSEAHPLHSSF